jgi:hypothetical protein
MKKLSLSKETLFPLSSGDIASVDVGLPTQTVINTIVNTVVKTLTIVLSQPCVTEFSKCPGNCDNSIVVTHCGPPKTEGWSDCGCPV